MAQARLCLLLGAILWSSGGFFIKEIDAGATSITFFRCLFAAAVLSPFMRGRGLPRAPDMAVSIILFALLLGLYVGATKATTAANAIFLQYTAPLYVIVFGAWLIGDRPRARDAAPFVICLLGIAILIAGNAGSANASGLWMGAGSGLFYGLFLLWLRRLRYADAIAVTVANCLGVAILFAVLPGAWNVGLDDLGLLLVMAVVQFAIPYVLFTRGLRDVQSGEASLIALIEPVLNPLWVVLLLGEAPGVATLGGGAVIVLGLVLRYTVLNEPAAAEPAAG
jgi:drug/metabolite transporter (DMT)-like permease